jgi:type IV pilus assembly protein PilE
MNTDFTCLNDKACGQEQTNMRHTYTANRHVFARLVRAQMGFTLIELMIVVVIVAILAAIAIPIYQRQIMESRRTSAKSALLDVASREEKYFSTNNAYTADLATLGYQGTGATITVPNNIPASDYYTIAVNLTGATTASTNFTATATPIAGSTQASDVCDIYTITDLGVQGNQGGSQTTGCW